MMRDKNVVLWLAFLLVFSGCLGLGFGTNNVAPGSVVIDNDSPDTHTVSLSVTKVSNSSNDIRASDESPVSTIWRKTYSYEVNGDERKVDSELLSEPGAYYVEVELENGENATTWLGLYPAGKKGEKVAESPIQIDIYDDGTVTAYTPTDD